MKSFNELRDINETILLGRYVRLGDRKAKVLKVHAQGEARFDTLYLVRFFDDQSQTIMHDSMLRPFLESYGAGEEGTKELLKKYKKDTPGESELEEGEWKDEKDEREHNKLFMKSLKTMPGSPKQKKIIQQMNALRKKNGLELLGESIDEEVPTTNTSGIAGVKSGDLPPVRRKRKRKKFAGAEVFEVESEEYQKFFPGPRKKYERWNRRLNMDSIDNGDIRKFAHRNPGKQIIVQDKTTGMMMYLRR